MRIILAAAATLAFSANALAQQAIADNMTCAQAQSYYERNGRIYKIANGKDVIPIYVGVPLNRKNQLRCDYGDIVMNYSTKTTDTRRCPIAWVCRPGFDFD